MDKGKKGSGLSSVITEVGIAAVLVILILGTLNYFAILPLSQTFPFLSFLPSQGQSIVPNNQSFQSTQGSSNNASIFTSTLIRPVEVRKLVNNGKDFLYSPIASSSVKPTGQIRIDMELVDTRDNNATQGSSLTFKNSLKYTDKEYRHLRVFYYPKNKNWVLEAKSGSKFQYFTLKKANPTGTNFAKIALVVGPQGKAVTLFVSGQKSKTVQLNSSLFDGGRQMNMFTQVAPNSKLDIYSLYYEY